MASKVFGYVRVSTKEQNVDRQIEAIKDYCKDSNIILVERDIYLDKASGKDFNRPQYQALKIALRKDDILIIKELDRLGRNMKQIKEEWQDLLALGINIIVIDTPILNTSNKSDLEKNLISNIVFELLSYMAEKERTKIKQRQAEGIAAAKAKGKHLGRPQINLSTLRKEQKNILKDNYEKWQDKEITGVHFMKMLELKRGTFYKIVKEYEMQK